MATHVETLAQNLPAEANGSPIDAALVISPPNRLYLTGMKSSAGFVLVTREKSYFMVDFRYYEAACQWVKDCQIIQFERIGETLGELIRKHGLRGILLENEGVSLSEARRLEKIFSQYGAQAVEDSTLDDLLWRQREIKSPEEIRRIQASQQITEDAFSHVLSMIRAGVTERELALELEFHMRRQGAQGVAFDLIVVAGAKGSLCHGEPDENQIHPGDFITMDIGALLDGYHSDMTRTVALGSVTSEQESVYHTVLKAQLAAIKGVKAGVSCSEIDKIARDIIYNAGYEGCFGHGTGHGVGLEIHEEPRFSMGCKTALLPGMVMTVEPGIYLPGRFGVRIEDMVAVTQDGCNNLTRAPKELIVL